MADLNQFSVRRIWLGWVSFWIYNAFVLQSAVLALDRIPRFFLSVNDKLIHAVEYTLLGFIASNAFEKARIRWLLARPKLFAVTWCILMGALTEWMQRGVPGRICSLEDWIANAIGGIFGAGLYGLLHRSPDTFTGRRPVGRG